MKWRRGCGRGACLALLCLVVACSGGGAPSTAERDPGNRAANLDGVYAFTVTEKAIRASFSPTESAPCTRQWRV